MARAEASDVVLAAYGAESLRFGPDYIIPKPFDPRLILEIAPLVAQAAMDSGVATRPIADMAAYRERLQRFVFRSGLLMKPVFDAAARSPRRVVYAEGEAERVLHCAQQALQIGIAEPILVGDTARITDRIRSLGLTIRPGEDVRIVDPNRVDAESYAADLHTRAGRFGVSSKEALRGVRADPTVLACLMLARGEADAAICGCDGRFGHHLRRVEDILGRRPGVRALSTLNALVLPRGTIFIADAYVNIDPSAEEIADLTELAAETMRRMGVTPRAALVSHANFGDRPSPSSQKMRAAMEILRARDPDFEVDGEMHADAALDPRLRARAYAHSSLTGDANLLIMPNADTAHVALNLLKVLGGGTPVGPILMGAGKPAHIASQSVTVRGLLNLTAIAVVEAQAATREEIRDAAE
jgi:malate dehydrogenase (oxaloacetate-decarboxylating)(NADP+)